MLQILLKIPPLSDPEGGLHFSMTTWPCNSNHNRNNSISYHNNNINNNHSNNIYFHRVRTMSTFTSNLFQSRRLTFRETPSSTSSLRLCSGRRRWSCPRRGPPWPWCPVRRCRCPRPPWTRSRVRSRTRFCGASFPPSTVRTRSLPTLGSRPSLTQSISFQLTSSSERLSLSPSAKRRSNRDIY